MNTQLTTLEDSPLVSLLPPGPLPARLPRLLEVRPVRVPQPQELPLLFRPVRWAWVRYLVPLLSTSCKQ
jgi:hypothetical protein